MFESIRAIRSTIDGNTWDFAEEVFPEPIEDLSVIVLHGGTVPGGTACEGTAGGGTVGNSEAQSGGLGGTVR